MQGIAAGVVQRPVPSQLLAGVNMSLAHDAAGQVEVTPAAKTLHAPVPLHVPSFPQGGAATQRASVPLAETFAHVPFVPPVRVALHAMHVAVQAVLQQKPSTQFPPLH